MAAVREQLLNDIEHELQDLSRTPGQGGEVQFSSRYVPVGGLASRSGALIFRGMDSDSDPDVDMAWVELAAGETKTRKRPISPPAEVKGRGRKRVRFLIAESTTGETERESLLERSDSEQSGKYRSEENGTQQQNVVMSVGTEDTFHGEETHAPGTSEDNTRVQGVNNITVKYNTSSIATHAEARHEFCNFPGSLMVRGEDKRPYAEPPAFDYERFVTESVPSDKLILEMFPSDPVARTAYRDVQTEYGLLYMFKEWAIDTASTELQQCYVGYCSPCSFHRDLINEMSIDFESVEEEFWAAERSLAPLQTWQKIYLGMDGKLEFARKELAAGKNIFVGKGGTEAQTLYAGRLEPLPSDDLATWESLHLGPGGTIAARGGKLNDYGYLFDPTYYGSSAATTKYHRYWFEPTWDEIPAAQKTYGHTFNFGVLGKMSAAKLTRDLGQGIDSFYGLDSTAKELAMKIFGYLLNSHARQFKHDLPTWEYFQQSEMVAFQKVRRILPPEYFVGATDAKSLVLLADGVGNSWSKSSTGLRLQIAGSKHPPFEKEYFGGIQARAKYGYLVWLHYSLDEDGTMKTVQERWQRGVDIFQCDPSWAGDSARLRYSQHLTPLSRLSRHDLETWERFHLDEDGMGTNKARQELAAGDSIFDQQYFGGEQARQEHGYLVWEINRMPLIGRCDISFEDLFSGWDGESAKMRHADLYHSLPRQPKHDLATWESFHLDGDGKVKPHVVERIGRYDYGLFEKAYWGGEEARQVYEFLLPRNLNRLLQGEDIFSKLREIAPQHPSTKQIAKGEHYIKLHANMPHSPKHDLETWECFHCPRGDVSKLRRDLEGFFDPLRLFSSQYYGGTEARTKYGYLIWEGRTFYDNTTLEEFVRSGRDLSQFLPESSKMEDWVSESVYARYRELIRNLPRSPTHDLATWEYFHCPSGNDVEVQKKLNRGERLFEKQYFGGIEARQRYACLTPRWMIEGYDVAFDSLECSDEDLESGYDETDEDESSLSDTSYTTARPNPHS